MLSDAVGCGNSTALPANCKLCAAQLLARGPQLLPFQASVFICFFPCTSCSDQESGSLAVVIIPCLLALSTVSVVALIFYSLHKNRARMQSATAPANHGTRLKPVGPRGSKGPPALFCVQGAGGRGG